MKISKTLQRVEFILNQALLHALKSYFIKKCKKLHANLGSSNVKISKKLIIGIYHYEMDFNYPNAMRDRLAAKGPFNNCSAHFDHFKKISGRNSH